MASWVTVTLAIAGPAVGGGLALFATWLSGQREDLRREADRRDGLRERGAEVIGPLRDLVQETEPLALGLFARPETLEGLRETWERWRVLRERLAVYAASHPSQQVVKIAYQLSPAVSAALGSATFFVRSVLEAAGGDENVRNQAVATHNRAERLSDELLAAIRDEAS